MKQSVILGATKKSCSAQSRPGVPFQSTGLALLAIMTTACQTTPFVATDLSCDVFQPIDWSRNDTAETALQIVQHNAAWTSVCAGGVKLVEDENLTAE